ncbi:MAG: dethiobiotin synthase [Anaerohalosphaeraceae bacterium]|nr:dethiobiotin synthase [Anaerohalosphaeraceae bacterium]
MTELKFKKHKGLFITATDTGVGKTMIAGSIVKLLKASGKNAGVFKPIATGCVKDRYGLVSSDTEFLAYCAQSEFLLTDITPENFITPAAPIAAEMAENRKVNLEKIVAAYNYMAGNTDCVLVEGIGGIRVPITENCDVLDLAKSLGLPVIIVARPDLGTINHTLLTINAVRGAGLTVAGVVINGYDESVADFAVETAPEVIAKAGNVTILAVVPLDAEASVEEIRPSQIVEDVLGEIDWQKIIGL